ncbi:Psf2-domain-containing protein [Neoconidiobolus thromboides FSU 785]|nr:Psf2-domain-containing protein [Neoconidiobolus thromboides FSU 785]
MALQKRQRGELEFDELEYLSEIKMIEIRPKFKMDRLQLSSGAIGPFKPPFRSKVPLGLALVLKSKNKCSIVPPEWLSIESLKKRLAEEREEPTFSKMNENFMEISKMLLDKASDDIKESNIIRNLLKEIQEQRQSKIRKGIEAINDSHLQMDNLTRFEVNLIKPVFKKGFQLLNHIQKAPPSPPGMDSTNNQ